MQKGSPFKGARKGQLGEKRTPNRSRRVTARRWGKVEVLCGAEEMSQNQSETDYSTESAGKLFEGTQVLSFLGRLLLFLLACSCPPLFFAALPQSHMEVGLRWVESTTFLLITSKLEDLLWAAEQGAWHYCHHLSTASLLYQDHSDIQWPQTRWRQDPLSAAAAGGSQESLLCGTDRLDKENSLVLFLHVGNNGLNDFPEVTQNVSRRGENKAYPSRASTTLPV